MSLTSETQPTDGTAFVTIAMPALNEERFIAEAINSVLPDRSEVACELLVLDGGSEDATREIVSLLAKEDDRIRLVNNPGRLQSAAMNLAADAADPRADILVRADCHAKYPPQYVAKLCRTMSATGATSVVVAMNTVGKTCVQKGIATAQNSRLGNGGSAHRMSGLRGFVDHGHHAAFDRKTFQRLGGYDASCPYNEDAEYDRRLLNSGGRIFLDGDILIDYYPRPTLSKLARQYANYGWGRAHTSLRHRTWPRLRQILPLCILGACVASVLLAVFVHPAALLVLAGYLGLVSVFALGLAFRERSRCALFAAPAAAAMHLSWAVGFLGRLWSHAIGGSASGPTATSISHGPKTGRTKDGRNAVGT